MNLRNVAVWVAVGMACSAGVRADQAADPRALAKAQFMLRQMSGELDAAKAENTQLKAELESLKAKKSSTDGALAKTKSQAQELQIRLDQTLADKQKTEETAADRSRQLDQCTGKNARLYELNAELLKRYADKGFVDVLTRSEPVTGLKKVEMENLLQDLQDKLNEQRVSAAQNSNPVGEH